MLCNFSGTGPFPSTEAGLFCTPISDVVWVPATSQLHHRVVCQEFEFCPWDKWRAYCHLGWPHRVHRACSLPPTERLLGPYFREMASTWAPGASSLVPTPLSPQSTQTSLSGCRKWDPPCLCHHRQTCLNLRGHSVPWWHVGACTWSRNLPSPLTPPSAPTATSSRYR